MRAIEETKQLKYYKDFKKFLAEIPVGYSNEGGENGYRLWKINRRS